MDQIGKLGRRSVFLSFSPSFHVLVLRFRSRRSNDLMICSLFFAVLFTSLSDLLHKERLLGCKAMIEVHLLSYVCLQNAPETSHNNQLNERT